MAITAVGGTTEVGQLLLSGREEASPVLCLGMSVHACVCVLLCLEVYRCLPISVKARGSLQLLFLWMPSTSACETV